MELPTPHHEKLRAILANPKLPDSDGPRIKQALKKYKSWVKKLTAVESHDVDGTIEEMVALLNEYRNYLDIDIIFDSKADFLYRQKGQTKLDNSVIEEFLPHLISSCVVSDLEVDSFSLGPRKAFSAVYFKSTLDNAAAGGGLHVRTKDQDFAIARRVFLKSSYTPDFDEATSSDFYIAYVAAECKTNLDKTMFQEASATAHDVKSAVAGAKYFLLCEWLDMTPQSTAATDIDEVLILRKAKRLSSNIRAKYGKAATRKKERSAYVDFLNTNQFDANVFKRLVEHVSCMLDAGDPGEEDVLDAGYF